VNESIDDDQDDRGLSSLARFTIVVVLGMVLLVLALIAQSLTHEKWISAIAALLFFVVFFSVLLLLVWKKGAIRLAKRLGL
jgi:Na+/proline symporter